MARLSKSREEDLWTLFDTFTRGWGLDKLKNAFYREELDEFHQFLFYVESKVEWFDWKDIDQIKIKVKSYVFMQDFLINNNSNIDDSCL